MKILSTFFALFLFCLSSSAQAGDPNWIFFNANLQVGIPLNRFGDNLGTVGPGAGGMALFQIRHQPIFIGVEGSWQTFEREQLEFSVNVPGGFEDYEWRTNTNMVLGHAVLRFQPDFDFFLWPYADAMVGFKNIYTKTRLIDLNGEEDEVVERISNQNDWALSYGAAVGVQFAPFENPGITFDLRLAYLPGQNATYLAKIDNVQVVEEPIEAFEERISGTTMLLPQLGVTIEIFTASE